MNYETIEYEIVEDGIGLLSLNRPRKFNSITHQMMEELEDFWRTRQNDLDTHVIIMKGNGDKGFCSGLDVRETVKMTKEMNTDQYYRFQSRMGKVILSMRQVPQPIIGMIHGPAVGLGFSFALASDVRIISDDVRFCAAYINIGLGGADMACSYFLPKHIGTGRAYEFMLTGNYMSATEAMSLGLVSRLTDREHLMETALEIARTMNSKNPMGLRLTKEAINMNLNAGGLEQVLNMEDRNQTLLIVKGILEKSSK